MSQERPYQTLPEFQQAHEELLERFDAGADTPTSATDDEARERVCLVAMMEPLREFMRRATAGGAYLYESRERRAAQGLLDYWASLCYGANLDLPRPLLAPHDPALLPKLQDEDCPYVGLEAFGERNSANFFGRGERVQALMQRLAQERLVVVTGASGSGKSSLVLAGLLPVLRAGGLPGSEGWAYPPSLVPGSTPLVNLAAALLPQASAADAEAWQARLREGPGALLELLGDRPHVIVVDQFEEVMTLRSESNAAEFNSFVAALQALEDHGATPHRLVLTMRNDVDTQLAREYPALNRRYGTAAFPLVSMDSNQLREAIEGPALRVGLKFQDGVVDELIRSVVGEDAGLPLLQFSLMALWDRRHGNLVTLDALRAVGSPRRAMTVAAERLYAELSPEQQLTTANLFLTLSRQGDGVTVFRNRVSRRRLHEVGEPNLVDRVVQRFEQARLLRVTRREQAGDDLVEVAHEALLRNWELLQTLFSERRDERERRAFLRKQALKWREAGFDDAFLLGGLALRQAAEEIERAGMSEVERNFIDKSVENERAVEQQRGEEAERRVALARQETEVAKDRALAAQRLSRSRLVLMVAALTAGLLSVAIIGVALYKSDNRMREANRHLTLAESKRLLAQANQLVDTDAEQSVVNAAQAVRLNPTLLNEAGGLVLESMRYRHFDLRIEAERLGPVEALALSPDGSRLLVAAGRELAEWDIGTASQRKRRQTRLAEGLQVVQVGYAGDGQLAVVTTSAGVWLWQDDRLWALDDKFVAQRIGVSDDGQWLTAISEDGRDLRAWHLPGGEPALSYTVPDKKTFMAGAWFSPDAQHLLVSPTPVASQPRVDSWVFSREGMRFLPKPRALETAPCRAESVVYTMGGPRVAVLLLPHLCLNTLDDFGAKAFDSNVSQLSDSAEDLALSSNGRYLLKLMRSSNEALFEDLKSGETLRLQGAFDLGKSNNYEPVISFSRDGSRLAIKGQDGSVRFFQLAPQTRQGAGRSGTVWVSADDRWQISRGSDNQVYDIRRPEDPGTVVRRITLREAQTGAPLYFMAPGGHRLQFSTNCDTPPSGQRRIQSFDLTQPKGEGYVELPCARWLSAGELHLKQDADTLTVYSGASPEPLTSLPITDAKPTGGIRPGIDISEAGRVLIREVVDGRLHARVQALQGGKLVDVLPLERDLPAKGAAIVFRGEGRALLFKTPTGSELFDLNAPQSPPLRIADAPAMEVLVDQRRNVAMVRSTAQAPWEVREMGTWKVLGSLPGDWRVNATAGVAFSRGDAGWEVRRLATPGQTLIKGNEQSPQFGFDRSGHAMTVKPQSDDRLRVYDLERGEVRLTIPVKTALNSSLTPGGGYLLDPEGRLLPSSAQGLLKDAIDQLSPRFSAADRCRLLKADAECAALEGAAPSSAASTSR